MLILYMFLPLWVFSSTSERDRKSYFPVISIDVSDTETLKHEMLNNSFGRLALWCSKLSGVNDNLDVSNESVANMTVTDVSET